MLAVFLAWISGNRSGGLNIGTRVAAGLTTGALAVLLAQPTDVVKVRFQAQQRALGTQTAPRYKSTLQAYRMIAKLEGARGLWKGEAHFSFHTRHRWQEFKGVVQIYDIAVLFLSLIYY